MDSKKGQGLSTNAIILIILGVIVLVVLILGFTIGWNRLLPFVSSNNVQNVVNSCGAACATGSVFDFCSQNRTLKADGLPDGEAIGTCLEFSANENYAIYGIQACSQISCP